MKISPSDTRIGWIGLGVMGQSMCQHLCAAGYPMTVFTRTAAKAEDVCNRGAIWADHPAEVAAASDVVFTMLGYPADVRTIYLDNDGLLTSSKSGTILIDMTTSEPLLAKEIARQGQACGLSCIDAPVSGGDVGARAGTLSIMLGGPQQTCDDLRPLLKILGATIVYQGGPGMGQHAKMVNQTLIASGMVGVCEALLYAYRAGLDLQKVLESVASGAAGSWSLTHLAPRILQGDFEPGFFVEHFVKDMGIALQEARRMKLSLPGLALAEQLYLALVAQGHGRSGTQALQLALASASGIDWTTPTQNPSYNQPQ
ncbi:MAG: oxidoreductase [Planctomycetaceae bacterium]|nr:oxidoreductase [Planctomycetaceae bacterium]|tara:strand:+ start:448 stop:1386 length:939 start_codon:yes stop_codon:yes gene_type:complete